MAINSIDWWSVLQPAAESILSQYANTTATPTAAPTATGSTAQTQNTAQSGNGIDWGGVLNSLGSLFGGGNQQSGGTNWLQTLLGGGLTLAGAAQKEPGEVLQARQSLRNIFTTPADFTAPGGIFASQLPVIQRQEQDILDQLQARYAAGLPSSIGGMGGGEVEALRKAGGEFALNRQALLGNLANQNVDRQITAANSVLANSRPDPMAAALSQLGVLLAADGFGGGGIGGIFGGGSGSGTGSGLNLGSMGQIAAAIPGVSGALSALGPIAIPAALAAAATYGGYKIGENNPKLADLPGWVKTLGVIATGGIGASVLFGANKAQKEQKAEYRRQDLDSQADQVQEIGSFFEQRMSQLGLDTSAFVSRIQQLVGSSASPDDEQSMIAREGGSQLLAAIQAQDPSIQSLNQVPGLRQEYIDYLVGSTFTSGNSSYGGGAPLNFINGPWAQAAGF